MTALAPLIFVLMAVQASQPVIVPPGGGQDVAVPFHPVRKLLPAAATEGAVTIYEFTVPPKSAGAPPHVHTKEDEYFYVLEGEVTVMHGNEMTLADPGTLAALPRGHQHAFWNAGDAPARMLAIVSGGNAFEPFFDALVVRLRDEGATGAARIGALVSEVAAEHGIEMRPDAVPPEARAYFGAPPQAGDKPAGRR